MRLPFSAAAVLLAMAMAAPASATLPPPSDEAKAKAAEAAAKAAHGSKVAAYQLCRSQDRVAADYFAAAKKSGTEVQPALPTPPCVDPGAFVPAAPAAAK
jgi:hypothetical protein